MKKITPAILTFVFILNGCATNTWYHNSKSPQQFYQDKIECRNVASRATPRAVNTYTPPTSYTYSTQANGYGGYNRVIRPANSGGFLVGASAGAAAYPQMVYNETFKGCLRAKGWYLK